ncbi:MAG: tetratricopeptide repeat protein [Bacteroidetes bacterium]|nr:tetratricopeptide repeat protein [Bacteroidota bacterium]
MTATEHAKKAERHLERNEWKQAMQECTEAISLEPSFGWAFYARGYAQYKGGDDNEALKDLNEAVRLMPADVDAAYLRASILGSLERYQETIDECTRLLNLNPLHGRTYLMRGINKFLGDVKSRESARLDFTRAIELGESEANEWLDKLEWEK